MPTLHLIDADSTQACPAVMAAIRVEMRRADAAGDDLLLLGGHPIRKAACCAGIEKFEQIAVPFGRVTLGLTALNRWAKRRPAYDLVHCWSPGAAFAAARIYKGAALRLSLAHTPGQASLKCLRRFKLSSRGAGLSVLADNAMLADRLASAGIRCRNTPLPLFASADTVISNDERTAIRRTWGINASDGCAVALLSDHPDLADATLAALISALAGATLQGASGKGVAVSLVMHPRQLHRRRAEDLFAEQTERSHVIQDARISEPWAVIGACDAALALGPDAGGLSLRWALRSGVPVIAPRSGPAGQIDDAPDNLRLAPSEHQKDLAHVLHGVLGDVQCAEPLTVSR